MRYQNLKVHKKTSGYGGCHCLLNY